MTPDHDPKNGPFEKVEGSELLWIEVKRVGILIFRQMVVEVKTGGIEEIKRQPPLDATVVPRVTKPRTRPRTVRDGVLQKRKWDSNGVSKCQRTDLP